MTNSGSLPGSRSCRGAEDADQRLRKHAAQQVEVARGAYEIARLILVAIAECAVKPVGRGFLRLGPDVERSLRVVEADWCMNLPGLKAGVSFTPRAAC